MTLKLIKFQLDIRKKRFYLFDLIGTVNAIKQEHNNMNFVILQYNMTVSDT